MPTIDLLLERGMMGDGVIDIARIRGWVEAAGYRGVQEVEFSPPAIGGSATPTRFCESAARGTPRSADPSCAVCDIGGTSAQAMPQHSSPAIAELALRLRRAIASGSRVATSLSRAFPSFPDIAWRIRWLGGSIEVFHDFLSSAWR